MTLPNAALKYGCPYSAHPVFRIIPLFLICFVFPTATFVEMELNDVTTIYPALCPVYVQQEIIN